MHLDNNPAVILVVGVNGTGKTTTIAKLAVLLQNNGSGVVLAAGDTFRAAAGAQLETWGNRLGVKVVLGQDGGDPASVAFDAIGSARARGDDVVIVDTAGRLHAKKNLMAELGKIHRVASGDSGGVDEVLLVLDATGGQNGVTQVREFSAVVPLERHRAHQALRTARGGIVIAIERQLGVPIKFVGLGEGIDDLGTFRPGLFRGRPPGAVVNREDLVAAARAAAENADPPYSHFRVGAVVVAADGQTFTGANIENAAYPNSSNCAEATAIHTAVAAPACARSTLWRSPVSTPQMSWGPIPAGVAGRSWPSSAWRRSSWLLVRGPRSANRNSTSFFPLRFTL